MKGKSTPNLSTIHVGADYETINKTLGEAEEVRTIYNGKRLYIYRKIAGLSPNMLDFTPNLILDIATLAIWEFTPYKDSKKSTYYITYDDKWKVETINRYIMQRDS
jgi:hypothetical protein